jgi:predicted flap endonuclease-1-like 5' DNA nuclease
MTCLVHATVPVTRTEVELLAQRLRALRSEIDEMLAALARPPAAQACAPDISEPSKPAAPKASPSADDLTLICGIDEDLCDQLNSLGFGAFAQIARWSRRDVGYVSEALGLGRRICKQNWIEQAAILARGDATAFAKRRSARPCDGVAAAPARQSTKADGLPPDTPAGERAPAAGGLSKITKIAPVLRLDPYRGVPRLPCAVRRAPPPAPRGRTGLAVKLAASLLALVLASLVMVDRDAWGGAQVPARKTSVAPLPLRAVPAVGCHDRVCLARC